MTVVARTTSPQIALRGVGGSPTRVMLRCNGGQDAHGTRRRRHGFTLMEVLAALVLVGIVLPVALRGITLSMQASARARHSTEAAELAQLKLNELVILNDPSAYAGNGEIDIDGFKYRWTSRSTSRDFGLYELAVDVAWTSAGREESTGAATLVMPSTTTSSSTEVTP